MPHNLPGGSMLKHVRQSAPARLKADAGLLFFFPLRSLFQKPLI
ncbi:MULTISPECIES: pyrBI operon leader peptide [Leclercia]